MSLDEELLEADAVEQLSDREIWRLIWTAPSHVFRFVHQHRYEKHLQALLIANGIVSALGRAMDRSLGDELPLWGIILLSVLMGLLLGYITAYIYCSLISWTGSWIGGKASTEQILRVQAYAYLPSIASIVPILLLIAISGIDAFRENPNFGQGIWIPLAYTFLGIALMVLAIWSIVLSVIGLSEVQGFSKVKAFGNMVLAVLVVAIPIVLIVGIFLL